MIKSRYYTTGNFAVFAIAHLIGESLCPIDSFEVASLKPRTKVPPFMDTASFLKSYLCHLTLVTQTRLPFIRVLCKFLASPPLKVFESGKKQCKLINSIESKQILLGDFMKTSKSCQPKLEGQKKGWVIFTYTEFYSIITQDYTKYSILVPTSKLFLQALIFFYSFFVFKSMKSYFVIFLFIKIYSFLSQIFIMHQILTYVRGRLLQYPYPWVILKNIN